ncbi:type VII secretion protein EccB [Phytomonospora sp. NPDC050363]|uniref:type VII secretion protein EccB n=1 Tax=Phytomonospora sp. NPDC050363 TaxID=3155642 RepID=UPI0033F5C4B8
MRTKREQVQAQRFIVRRIVSAMISGEPETLDLPMRRVGIAAFAGVLIFALVFAGFWVVGLIFPGGAKSWMVDGAIIVEEETGTRYIYAQGELHPVQNFASALLIVGNGDRKVHSVHQQSLKGTPRGRTLGIQDAPDALPTKDLFISLPWQTCSAPNPVDPTARDSYVLVGAPLSPATDLAGQGLVLANGDNFYLVLGATKYLIDAAALPALGTDKEQAIRVDDVLVNALRTGPDLVVEIPRKGRAGRDLEGERYKIGDVFTNNEKFYVLVGDGLASIGELSAELLGTKKVELATATVIANQSATVIEPADFPQLRPDVREGLDGRDTAVCSVFDDQELTIAVHTPVPGNLSSQTTVAPVGEGDEINTADHVWLPGGYGALVRAEATPEAPGGTVYLVTDQGWKFGLTPEAITAFGYEKVTPTPIPSGLLALLPTGPELSQAAALTPSAGTGN